MYRLAHEIKNCGFTSSVALTLSSRTFTSLYYRIRVLMYVLEVCSISHRVLAVCVKKCATSRGKESSRLSSVYKAHFCPLCSGVGGSRLPKLSALLKGSVC